MNEQQGNAAEEYGFANDDAAVEFANCMADAAKAIRAARPYISHRKELAGTLEGYERHLSRLAARFGGAKLATAEQEPTCASCKRRAPTLPGFLEIALSGAWGVLCPDCSERYAPGLFKSLEEILRLDTFPADLEV